MHTIRAIRFGVLAITKSLNAALRVTGLRKSDQRFECGASYAHRQIRLLEILVHGCSVLDCAFGPLLR